MEIPTKPLYPYSMTKNAQYTQAERDLKKAVANHVVWLRGLLTQKGEVRAQHLEELFDAVMEVSDDGNNPDRILDIVGL